MGIDALGHSWIPYFRVPVITRVPKEEGHSEIRNVWDMGYEGLGKGLHKAVGHWPTQSPAHPCPKAPGTPTVLHRPMVNTFTCESSTLVPWRMSKRQIIAPWFQPASTPQDESLSRLPPTHTRPRLGFSQTGGMVHVCTCLMHLFPPLDSKMRETNRQGARRPTPGSKICQLTNFFNGFNFRNA